LRTTPCPVGRARIITPARAAQRPTPSSGSSAPPSHSRR
jgi:hypothetical protein